MCVENYGMFLHIFYDVCINTNSDLRSTIENGWCNAKAVEHSDVVKEYSNVAYNYNAFESFIY